MAVQVEKERSQPLIMINPAEQADTFLGMVGGAGGAVIFAIMGFGSQEKANDLFLQAAKENLKTQEGVAKHDELMANSSSWQEASQVYYAGSSILLAGAVIATGLFLRPLWRRR